jgi:signal peptidase
MRRVRSVGRRIGLLAVWSSAVGSVALLSVVGIGPHTGRYRTLTVLTASMRPAMPAGSVVIVTPERPDRLRVGQVVTYRIPVEDHRVISHRVVRIVEGGDRPVFQTRGDANDAPDYWLARVEGGTVWHVRHVVPRLGLALNWLRRPTVHLLAVAVVPAALALLLLVEIWRDEAVEPSMGCGRVT